MAKVGVAVRATFECNRPSPQHHLDHGGQNKDDDSLDNTTWVTPSENNSKQYKDPSFRTDRYNTETLPINVDILDDDDDDDVEWHRHPTLPVMVDDGGTHVYHTERKTFLNIKKREYRKSGWVDVAVWVGNSCHQHMGHLALECYIGRLLEKGEQSDHANCDRSDNSRPNLRPRYPLFQSNHRRPGRISTTTKTQGVSEQPEKYSASVPMYTPDGPINSTTKRFSFYKMKLGEKEAFEQAKACRDRHYPPVRNVKVED